MCRWCSSWLELDRLLSSACDKNFLEGFLSLGEQCVPLSGSDKVQCMHQVAVLGMSALDLM
jgi:hypothetical protein